ncbi:MAG: elongation factor G [Clostridiales bacterium]|jgi:elongation factor G|nr:elongation factor G [Clostridiales bacterium]
MKDYSVQKLRNVCLLSHGGAGKTTLAEAAMYNTGALDRLGKISDGTTATDYDPEEIKRKISINLAVAPFEWGGCKVNMIDTPGYFDFVGEVRQGLRASESALILISARDGVAVGTEKSWEYASESKLPRMVFVNKMDDENADFDKTLEQAAGLFGKSLLPFQLPIAEGGKLSGVVDVIARKAYRFNKENAEPADMPAASADRVDQIWEQLKELIAEASEELMEKYFGGEDFTPEEISRGLRDGVCSGSIVPVLCGSALSNAGIKLLMDAIVAYLPDPAYKGAITATRADSGEPVELKPSESEPVSALVFKTIADPFVGRISIFKVFSGTMKTDSVLYNATSEKTEKIAQLFVLRGKKQIPTDKVIAGDIGAAAKLQNTSTNDTLSDVSAKVVLDKIAFPEPCISLAVEAKAKGDEEKISSGLQRLQDEDLTFKVYQNAETKQMIISGIGEQHLDVLVSKLKAKFNVGVNLIDPKVPYRETIRKKIKVEGKHKKQSGGHGQYGHVWVEFEPGEADDLEFNEKIFGGAVPKQYFPAVEKGLKDAIQKGVLAGYPVVKLRATLVDGSYHDVDSSEMAFKLAARLAYKKGLPTASPVILEPIDHVEVNIPDSYMGDIIGDLNKRRGRIMGMEPQSGGGQQVLAEVPAAEMFKYANDLRSMTQGRGSFKEWFERYEEAPANIAQKIIEGAKKDLESDEDDE